MARKQRTTDGSQRLLLFTRRQRLDALEAIDAEVAGATRQRWGQIVDMLTQIEKRTGADGCFCYAETLWAVMNRGAGVSRRTFFRVRADAEALGLVTIEHRYNRQGQQSNEWRIHWPLVASLAAKSGHVASRAEPAAATTPTVAGESASECQTDTGGCQNGTGGCQTGTPLIGILRSSLRSSVDDRRPEQIDDQKSKPPKPEGEKRAHAAPWSPERRERVKLLANLAVDKLRRRWPRLRCNEAGDRSLVVKAAWLGVTRFGEAWFNSAIEGVRLCAKRRPWGYLTTIVANDLAERGLKFETVLAAIDVPPELLEVQPAAVDLSRRLCTVEEGER